MRAEMGREHLFVTVHKSTYRRLEEARKQDGQKRSVVVEEAIRYWLRLRDERLMQEGCIKEARENAKIAAAAKRMAARVPLE